MPSHSIVQSVLLRRSAFRTLDEARKWITDHGYKYSMPDVTPTYYRFRQHAPEPLALTHRLRTTQLGESDKFSPMGSVGALIIAYPKSSRPMAKDPPAAAGAGAPNPMDQYKVGDLVRVEYIVDIKRKHKTMIVTKKTPKSVTVEEGRRTGGTKFFIYPSQRPLVFRKISPISGEPQTTDERYTIVGRVARDVTAIYNEETSGSEAE